MSDKPKARGLQDLLGNINLNGAGRSNGEPVVDDVLSRRPSKAKRSRAWEKRHAHVTVTYRGVPPAVREAVKAASQEQGLNVGVAACRLLEHGLTAYLAGDLDLQEPGELEQEFEQEAQDEE